MNVRGSIAWLVLVGSLGSFGCGGDVLDPAAMHSFYEASTADGQPLPITRFAVVSNAAGSCESDLIGVTIMVEDGHYNLSVTMDRRCSGTVGTERISSRSAGEVIRSGDELRFTATTPAEYRIVEAALSTSGLSATLQRGSGTTFDVQFDAVPGLVVQ
ncbi:MAG TPA: hypothetical protein VHG09_00790 [Longimicrobiales bacterium]|nr:hypothetical protein [Longimicrobiales bacterium]